MPWKGVAVSEQRLRFLEDDRLNDYSISELADRFSISRKTDHKWIARYEERGLAGYRQRSRSPRPAAPAQAPTGSAVPSLRRPGCGAGPLAGSPRSVICP
jgi:transposase-like protein